MRILNWDSSKCWLISKNKGEYVHIHTHAYLHFHYQDNSFFLSVFFIVLLLLLLPCFLYLIEVSLLHSYSWSNLSPPFLLIVYSCTLLILYFILITLSFYFNWRTLLSLTVSPSLLYSHSFHPSILQSFNPSRSTDEQLQEMTSPANYNRYKEISRPNVNKIVKLGMAFRGTYVTTPRAYVCSCGWDGWYFLKDICVCVWGVGVLCARTYIHV